MNYIGAILLVHMSAEDAFFTLVALVLNQHVPHSDPTLTTLHLACHVLDAWLLKHRSVLATYFRQHHISCITFVPRWWMSGWDGCPWESRLRIFDCIMVEGFFAFYKATLVILDCLQDSIFHTYPTEILSRLICPPVHVLQPTHFTEHYLTLQMKKKEIDQLEKKYKKSSTSLSSSPTIILSHSMSSSSSSSSTSSSSSSSSSTSSSSSSSSSSLFNPFNLFQRVSSVFKSQ
ncbi:hypothetical protein HMI54_003153 [Coelomomyces lativittatus]|nr:hypothetical protein HMI54_003153 [Coelomomyces lativittatus]